MNNEQRAQDFARNLKEDAFSFARKYAEGIREIQKLDAKIAEADAKIAAMQPQTTDQAAIALDYAHKHVSDALRLIYAGIRKGEYQAGAHGATERLRRMLTELVEIGNQFDEEAGR